MRRVLIGLGKRFPCLWAVVPLLLLPANAWPEERADDAFTFNRRLGRGMNLGNALEAPREGQWGLTLKAEYFRVIKDAGFDSVRLPICWSAHAAQSPPYEIDPAFLKRVDWALDQALRQGLAVVLDLHHYGEMYADPNGHLPRIKALWRQIGRRYRDRPDGVFFELLNEPHGALNDQRWNRMLPELLAAARAGNPRRLVIVGGEGWNNLYALDKLVLPRDDRLIVTFHYYSPFEFTHQGANWVAGSEKWKGRTWTGTPQQQEAVRKDIARAAAWGKKHGRPLYLGEFGAFSAADLDSRVRWTQAVVEQARRHAMSWAYWEFGAGFGAYEPVAGAWREPLLRALVPRVTR